MSDLYDDGNSEVSSDTMEKYPSWPKGHPWKGCRALIASRGFKSLLLRSTVLGNEGCFFMLRLCIPKAYLNLYWNRPDFPGLCKTPAIFLWQKIFLEEIELDFNALCKAVAIFLWQKIFLEEIKLVFLGLCKVISISRKSKWLAGDEKLEY